MKPIVQSHYASAAEIALRWAVHRTTVPRVMHQFGCAGIKLGESAQSARRFAWADVYRIEQTGRMKISAGQQFPKGKLPRLRKHFPAHTHTTVTASAGTASDPRSENGTSGVVLG